MKKLQNPQTLHKTLAGGRLRRKKSVVVHIPIVEEAPLLEEFTSETVQRPHPSARWRSGSGVFRFIVSLVVVASIGSLVAFAAVHSRLYQSASPQSVALPVAKSDAALPATTKSLFHRALDGVVVASTKQENPALVAISIDNSQDARPQVGIDRALWVYEFPAEATITRWLGIFTASATTDDVAQIGPVRSLRPYMAEIARSLGAVVVHSGGSPDALSLIGRFAKDYPSINEFSQTPYFWRDPTRSAPHNLFTAISRLREHPTVLARIPSLKPLPWQEAVPVASSDRKQLVIGYQEPYQARWAYSSSDALFHRVDEGGNAWKSPSGVEVTTPTIVVQFANMKILDRIGRREIKLKGTGEAMVLAHGSIELGKWVRNNPNDRTTLETIDGEPLAIPSGRLWWNVVPTGTEVTFE